MYDSLEIIQAKCLDILTRSDADGYIDTGEVVELLNEIVDIIARDYTDV